MSLFLVGVLITDLFFKNLIAAHIFYSIRRKAPKISPQDCMASPEGCMESTQRVVCYQADKSMHGYTVITYA